VGENVAAIVAVSDEVLDALSDSVDELVDKTVAVELEESDCS